MEIRLDLDEGFSEATWPGFAPGWAGSKASTPSLVRQGWMLLDFDLKFLTKLHCIMAVTTRDFSKTFLSVLRVLTGDDGFGAPPGGVPEVVGVGLVASITL